MMNINPNIKLRYYREYKKMSQKQLAENLGISQGYISKIERGIESPTTRMLCKFATELNICPRLLIECKNNCECEDKT